jgi:hypothetical protein
MEWWILAGAVLALSATAAFARLRKSRQENRQKETKNIYPLW